jgi:arylsulfatase A-like enzyme
MDLTEGGIRVPYIVRWPKVVATGVATEQQAMTMDWAVTMFDIAGIRPGPEVPLDGISLLPVLKDPDATIGRRLYWRMKYRGQKAMRDGRWKYLAIDQHEYLFDLSQDERERANLARRQPERLATMRRQYDEWNATMAPIPADAKSILVYTEADMPAR